MVEVRASSKASVLVYCPAVSTVSIVPSDYLLYSCAFGLFMYFVISTLWQPPYVYVSTEFIFLSLWTVLAILPTALLISKSNKCLSIIPGMK